MTRNYKINSELYKQNRRPRQLRGYLAFSGVDQLMSKIAQPHLDEHARRTFSTLVPDGMRAAMETLLFADGTFTVYTGHAQWASWVRGRSRRLRDGLNAAGLEVRAVRAVVCPTGGELHRRPAPDRPQQPPASTPELLRGGAAGAASDGLREALNRLAERIESRNRDKT